MGKSRTFASTAKPSSRSFSPGDYPEQVFEAANGAKTVIRYGNKRVNATLQLGFTNISDLVALDILEFYQEVSAAHDWITFKTEQFAGMDFWLRSFVEYNPGLKWRFSQPPQVTSVQPDISNVSCSFVACLDGD